MYLTPDGGGAGAIFEDLEIEVPPGAVSKNTTIFGDKDVLSDGTLVFLLGPDDAGFAKPVTIRVTAWRRFYVANYQDRVLARGGPLPDGGRGPLVFQVNGF